MEFIQITSDLYINIDCIYSIQSLPEMSDNPEWDIWKAAYDQETMAWLDDHYEPGMMSVPDIREDTEKMLREAAGPEPPRKISSKKYVLTLVSGIQVNVDSTIYNEILKKINKK